MPRKHPLQTKHRHLKMWLAVAGSFLVVVGVWMVQLKVNGKHKTETGWGAAFGQELKNSSLEFNALFEKQKLPTVSTVPATDDQKIQAAVLERMKEKILQPN